VNFIDVSDPEKKFEVCLDYGMHGVRVYFPYKDIDATKSNAGTNADPHLWYEMKREEASPLCFGKEFAHHSSQITTFCPRRAKKDPETDQINWVNDEQSRRFYKVFESVPGLGDDDEENDESQKYVERLIQLIYKYDNRSAIRMELMHYLETKDDLFRTKKIQELLNPMKNDLKDYGLGLDDNTPAEDYYKGLNVFSDDEDENVEPLLPEFSSPIPHPIVKKLHTERSFKDFQEKWEPVEYHIQNHNCQTFGMELMLIFKQKTQIYKIHLGKQVEWKSNLTLFLLMRPFMQGCTFLLVWGLTQMDLVYPPHAFIASALNILSGDVPRFVGGLREKKVDELAQGEYFFLRIFGCVMDKDRNSWVLWCPVHQYVYYAAIFAVMFIWNLVKLSTILIPLIHLCLLDDECS